MNNEARSYGTPLEGGQGVHSNSQEKENLLRSHNSIDPYHSLNKLEYFSDLTPRDLHYLTFILRQALALITNGLDLPPDEGKRSLCNFIEYL